MFTPSGLFRNIPCPGKDKCAAINCIFSHDPEVLAKFQKPPEAFVQSNHALHNEVQVDRPIVKRRKLDDGSGDDKRQNAAMPESTTNQVKAKNNVSTKVQIGSTLVPKIQETRSSTPKTLNKPITPPPTHQPTSNNKATVKRRPRPTEPLHPRTLPTPPAGHDKRFLYLRYIHEELKRLNGLVVSGDRKDKSALTLDDQELISASLDEEEQLAKGNSAVYANHIKQRISQLKKMKLDDWVTHLKTNVFGSRTIQNDQPARPVKTGLSADQEWKVLRDQLLTPLDKLVQLGFVVLPPSIEAIDDARRMVVQAANWEVCDRCKTRFQVFPERREEDGVLTTNGPCAYHWGKLRRPERKKTDAQTGTKEAVYACCGEVMNTPGCSSAESHVYKMQEPARMAAVIPFINTPENAAPASIQGGSPPLAITFDCEMGYTVYGLELIRMTAVSWPGNEEIVDILVQPKGTILDFNSRFSGVFPDTFRSAIKWGQGMAHIPAKREGEIRGSWPLPIVSSPEVARAILCSYITPDTPLIGHALENDLNSVRLCHTKVVDTVALYPHPKGLPIRHSLKQLTLVHLERMIQTGGASGHDSLEDARATGDLVRVKAGKKWEEMKRKEIKA